MKRSKKRDKRKVAPFPYLRHCLQIQIYKPEIMLLYNYPIIQVIVNYLSSKKFANRIFHEAFFSISRHRKNVSSRKGIRQESRAMSFSRFAAFAASTLSYFLSLPGGILQFFFNSHNL
jgi:ATP-dependent helicase/DNAse subunit B